MGSSSTSAVGKFFPIRWQCLLHQEPMHFSPQMLCALELEDPAVASEISAKNEEKDADAPVYIFVKVIERVPIDVGGLESLTTSEYRVQIGEDSEKTVAGIFLYAFDPIIEHLLPPESYTNCKLNVVNNSTVADENVNSVEKIIENISKASQDLTEGEQQFVVKRHYLHWHSIKNEEDVRNGTFHSQVTQSIRQKFSMENLFDRLDVRASNRAQQRFEINRNMFDFTDAISFNGPGGQYVKMLNPQPREAERWIRQAEFDIESARNEMRATDGTFVSPEWACFKCHQAVEKALKAAQIKKDADFCNTHNLRELCHGLMGIDAVKVGELVKLCIRSEAMRYPDCHRFPKIPRDVYKDRSERVVDLAADIITSIKLVL